MSYNVRAVLLAAKEQLQSKKGCRIQDRESGGSFEPVAFSVYSGTNAAGRYERVTVHRESEFPDGKKYINPILHVIHLDPKDGSLYYKGEHGMDMVHLKDLEGYKHAYRVYPESFAEIKRL